MPESLFTSQVPNVPNASDGAPGIAGSIRLIFALPGLITHVRFYATTTISGTYVVELWQMTVADTEPSPTGTLLATKTLSAPPVPGWNQVALDTPVAVDTTHVYVADYWSSAGRYVATLGQFTSAGLTNGNIYAPANGENVLTFGVRNGCFRINAAPGGYPTDPGNGTNYFADVVYVATVGPHQGASDFGLGIAVASAGSRPSQGSAGLDLQLELSATGFTPPTAPVVDPIGSPVAEQLLACLTEQLMELPSPPKNIHLRVGQETGPLIGPNVDECCAGLAWIRIANIYPSWDSFPAADNTWTPCGPLAYAVVLEMGVAFCMPWSDSDDTFDNQDPPNAEDWATAFATQMQHQTLMRRAAACCWLPTQRRAVGEWSPLPVEGGCTGGKLLVTVSVMAPCSDC